MRVGRLGKLNEFLISGKMSSSSGWGFTGTVSASVCAKNNSKLGFISLRLEPNKTSANNKLQT